MITKYRGRAFRNEFILVDDCLKLEIEPRINRLIRKASGRYGALPMVERLGNNQDYTEGKFNMNLFSGLSMSEDLL